MRLYQVTTKSFSAGYEVDEYGVVRNPAPILRKFIGKNHKRLESWVVLIGGTIKEIVDDKV